MLGFVTSRSHSKAGIITATEDREPWHACPQLCVQHWWTSVARNFHPGKAYLPGYILKTNKTVLMSFLVKLKDGCVLKHHLDHAYLKIPFGSGTVGATREFDTKCTGLVHRERYCCANRSTRSCLNTSSCSSYYRWPTSPVHVCQCLQRKVHVYHSLLRPVILHILELHPIKIGVEWTLLTLVF